MTVRWQLSRNACPLPAPKARPQCLINVLNINSIGILKTDFWTCQESGSPTPNASFMRTQKSFRGRDKALTILKKVCITYCFPIFICARLESPWRHKPGLPMACAEGVMKDRQFVVEAASSPASRFITKGLGGGPSRKALSSFISLPRSARNLHNTLKHHFFIKV